MKKGRKKRTYTEMKSKVSGVMGNIKESKRSVPHKKLEALFTVSVCFEWRKNPLQKEGSFGDGRGSEAFESPKESKCNIIIRLKLLTSRGMDGVLERVKAALKVLHLQQREKEEEWMENLREIPEVEGMEFLAFRTTPPKHNK